MNQITIIEGDDLAEFLRPLMQDVYRVRIWATGNGSIKVKVNEGIWTWAIGKADEGARA